MQGYDAETGIYYPVEQRGWIDTVFQIASPYLCDLFSPDCDGSPAPPPPPPEEKSFNWRPILVAFGVVVVIVTVIIVVIKYSKK